MQNVKRNTAIYWQGRTRWKFTRRTDRHVCFLQ